MPIQGDLIILPKSNFLPLPWTVRGALGLETGTEVSLAVVKNDRSPRGLPDIIVTPLQADNLYQTFTIEATLGERSGAVADFLTWFGSFAAKYAKSRINISLSETNTIEGGQRHIVHMIIEPIPGSVLLKATINKIVSQIKKENAKDVISIKFENTYDEIQVSYEFSESLVVRNGWIKYDGWLSYIKANYRDNIHDYDLGKVVLSCSPDQRLLRFIIPKKEVLQIKVRHKNIPNAMQEIAAAIKQSQYNILSLRLSRTPGNKNIAATKSMIVAACEPVNHNTNSHKLRRNLDSISRNFQVNEVEISGGSAAESAIYLIPNSIEQIQIDPAMRSLRDDVRSDIAAEFSKIYGAAPRGYIFLSRRFIARDNAEAISFAQEQSEAVAKIEDCLGENGIALVQAKEPQLSEWRQYDEQIHNAVYARLWASDACVVLALDEKGNGDLSPSMGHEIGFFLHELNRWLY